MYAAKPDEPEVGHGRPTAKDDPLAAVHQAGRRLAQQLATAEDSGYFGPTSAMWLLHREAVLGLGLGRALLLQLAHPWVATAVAEHSTFQAQPLDRLLGTVTAAEFLIFGSRRQAEATAAGLRRLHGRVSGTLPEEVGRWPLGSAYRADDPAALLWVLVTLLDTTIRLYEGCVEVLAAETLKAYLVEGARLGELLGVPSHTVPADRAALQDYMEAMIGSRTVAVGSTARALARALLRARIVPGPEWRVYSMLTRAVAAATLPGVLQAQYGTLVPSIYRPLGGVGGTLMRAIVPRLPERLRLDPMAAIAMRRSAGRRLRG